MYCVQIREVENFRILLSGTRGYFNGRWPKSFTDCKFPNVVKIHQGTIPLNEEFGSNLLLLKALTKRRFLVKGIGDLQYLH